LECLDEKDVADKRVEDKKDVIDKRVLEIRMMVLIKRMLNC